MGSGLFNHVFLQLKYFLFLIKNIKNLQEKKGLSSKIKLCLISLTKGGL